MENLQNPTPSLGTVARKALRRAGRLALLRPYMYVRDRAAWIVFDRGVIESTQRASPVSTAAPDGGREVYEPLGWLTLPRCLRRRDVDSHDVFIDYGSGMGRAVYVAAQRYDFARVVGVEYSAPLHESACRNIERNRHRLRCRSVDLVNADATQYELPDDVTVVFIFNSFQGDVFREVLARIVASLDRAPRRLRLIYANPVMQDVVDETRRFEVIRRVRLWRRWPRRPSHPWILVYESIPA